MLRELFNDYLAETREIFPGLAGKIVIIEPRADDSPYVYGAGDSGPTLLRENASKLAQAFRDLNSTTSANAYAQPGKGGTTGLITIDMKLDPEAELDPHQSTRTIRMLDHELGHLIIPGGFYLGAKSESVADAYALLRHYQRHGTEAPLPRGDILSPQRRAGALIFSGDASHFTLFTIEAIRRCRNALDWEGMTPEKTVSIARKFAQTYTPPREQVRAIVEAFAPVSRLSAQNRRAEAIDKLIEITLSPESDRFVFRTGEVWLRAFLTQGAHYRDGQQFTLSTEQKALLRRQLDMRAAHLAKTAPRLRRTPIFWRAHGLNG